MKRFVQGADRGQTTLLPECLDDFIDEDNAVRAVDIFVSRVTGATKCCCLGSSIPSGFRHPELLRAGRDGAPHHHRARRLQSED